MEINRIPLHGAVICDSCNRDYTGSDEEGGFIFSSYAYCPKCAPRMMASIQQYGEEEHIAKRAEEGQTFYEMVLDYRAETGQDDAVIIYTFGDDDE